MTPHEIPEGYGNQEGHFVGRRGQDYAHIRFDHTGVVRISAKALASLMEDAGYELGKVEYR